VTVIRLAICAKQIVADMSVKIALRMNAMLVFAHWNTIRIAVTVKILAMDVKRDAMVLILMRNARKVLVLRRHLMNRLMLMAQCVVARRNGNRIAVMEPRLAMIAWLHAKGSMRQRSV